MNSIPVNIEDTTRNNILFQLLNVTRTTSPIVMFFQTPSGNRKVRHEGTPKFRWKVYLWQFPDDLVSWYLPQQDPIHVIRTLQTIGIIS